MIKKNYKDVQEEVVTKANSTKTTIRWLVTKDDGAQNYMTRRFEILPGGQIGIHNHPEEHHIYILEGEGLVIDAKKNKIGVRPGDVLYIPPDEPHGYENNSTTVFAFLCIIPYLE
ncbi:MAG: cupin domain-containing protein [Promethearchaeota archaeon]